MTFSGIIQAVLDRYSEATNQRFVSLADAQRAVIEGYAWMSDATEWLEVRVPMLLRSGRVYYDLRSYFSDDSFLRWIAFFHPATNRWLIPEPTRYLDGAVFPFWEEVYGNPEFVVSPAYGWVGFFAQPIGDDDRVIMYASRLPEEPTVMSLSPAFPSQFHIGLVEYALSDLFSQDGEVELALQHWGSYADGDVPASGYLKHEDELRSYVRSRATLDRHTIVGMGYPRTFPGSVR